jgi:hypothetical protein
MAQLLFANNATSNLAGPLTSTATAVNLTAGSGVLFPTPSGGSYFKLTFQDAATGLISEIVHVTAVAGDTFTIVRGQEGTTAVNWLAGDFAGNLVTAGSLAAFAQSGSLPTSLYVGTDTGTTNALVVTTTTPTLSAPSAGQLFMITKSGSAGNTGAVTLKVGTGSVVSVVYADGSALLAGDYPASATGLFYFTGGVFQVIAFGNNVHSLVLSTITNNLTTISPQIFNALHNASAFTPVVVLADMPTAGVDYVLQTLTVTSASYIDARGTVAFRNDNASARCGFTLKLRIVGVGDSQYVGAALPPSPTAASSIQMSVTVSKKFQGLNPATTYTLQLIGQKIDSVGPLVTLDGYLSSDSA